MPLVWQLGDGVRHERAGRNMLLVAAMISAPAAMRWGWLPAPFLLGMWAGFYLTTPDADLLAATRSETRWFADQKRNGPLSWMSSIVRFYIGWLSLALGFWPGLLLSHRGISHWPIIGAAVIAVLMAASLPGVAAIAFLAYIGRLDILMSPAALACWLGFMVAHFTHILLDKIW